MASSPATPAPSTKRPLEDLSSPSGRSDQPDAKRPALDKLVEGEAEAEKQAALDIEEPAIPSSNGELKLEAEKSTNGDKSELENGQADALVEDAPAPQGTQAIESTISSTGDQSASGGALQHDESGWIHIRSVISSAEAATVIGKGGENVTLIRKMSGAKCTVSDYQKGAVERILTVSGVVDAAAKVIYQSYQFEMKLTFIGIWFDYPHLE